MFLFTDGPAHTCGSSFFVCGTLQRMPSLNSDGGGGCPQPEQSLAVDQHSVMWTLREGGGEDAGGEGDSGTPRVRAAPP